MLKEFEYPFDAEYLLKKKKSLRRKLLDDPTQTFIDKKIAVLGGQTTNNIVLMLECFLLNYGIRPTFYESEYNKYYEDAVFPNVELDTFEPDLIYICTCSRSITDYPQIEDDQETVERKLNAQANHLQEVWTKLTEKYHCPIVQNNFEYPHFRLMGNKDCSDYRGRVNFISSLNSKLYAYAQTHENFFICDVNYISAAYGLDKWADPYYWHMYKYGVAVPAIPVLAFEVSKIIKSLYGKNKKAFNLDLDNTLWGGIVGDDGAENIEIGQETSLAQIYSEFQEYIKLHKSLGVLLTINSKNERENALAGLKRPDSVLHEEDFISIKANWEPKSMNLAQTAKEMDLLPDSFVFVDDNPAERAIVSGQFPNAAVPVIDGVERYIHTLDRSGFFEVTAISKDDMRRSEMYRENAKRNELQSSFTDYKDYLISLEMEGEIQAFIPTYMSRIAQLTNKSNQFNLTTKRYSQAEIEEVARDKDYMTLYGRLKDRFGDNGIVSVLIGKIQGEQKEQLHMELWLMSCRVLKREMEFAMMDALVERAREMGIREIFGYYYPTKKNLMVKDFYALQGFSKIGQDEMGNTTWKFVIDDQYQKKQNVIAVG